MILFNAIWQRSTTWYLLAFFLSIVVGPAVLHAQGGKNEGREPVAICFTALTKNDEPVQDLSEHELSMVVDGKELVITNVSLQARLPMMLGVLIDTSKSARNRPKYERDQLIEFLRTAVGPQDKALVAGFGSDLTVAQNYTSDMNQLVNSIGLLQQGDATRMYDAVLAICLGGMSRDEQNRRVLILMTDGNDNLSSKTKDEVIEAAIRTKTTIYGFHLATAMIYALELGRKNLVELTEATGGKAFLQNDERSFKKSFDMIQREAESRYDLQFRPEGTKSKPGLHQVKLRAKRQGVRVFSPRWVILRDLHEPSLGDTAQALPGSRPKLGP